MILPVMLWLFKKSVKQQKVWKRGKNLKKHLPQMKMWVFYVQVKQEQPSRQYLGQNNTITLRRPSIFPWCSAQFSYFAKLFKQ